jgi:ribosomal protein L22
LISPTQNPIIPYTRE